MKKLLFIFFSLTVAASVFGADSLSQLTMTISTPGPDCYKDGSRVLDGETYLLVYLKTNAAFKGVLMNGSLADPVNNVIAATARALNGGCAFKAIQFSPNLFPSTGKWLIALLDTRKADGTAGGLVVNSGASGVVSGPSATSPTVNDLLASSSSGSNLTLTSTVIAASVPGTPAPVITAIYPHGASITVSFNNLANGNNYYLQEVTGLDSNTNTWTTTPVVNPIPCFDSAATISVDVPAPATNQTVQFFRVVTPLPTN
jgi:hypothetical protein